MRKRKADDDFLASRINEAYWDAEEEGDWMNFHIQSRLSSQVDDELDVARRLMAKGKYEPAIEAGFTTIQNNIDAINHNDDSCGYLGGIMNNALHLLRELAAKDLDDDSRELFIDFCSDCLKGKIFDGWHWYIDIYDYLVMLARTPDECRKLIKKIKKDKELGDEFYVEKQHEFIHRLIEKSDGEEAALQYQMQNLQVEAFRKQAIDRAISAKDFARAYQLGDEGIKQDEENYSGCVSTWHYYLLKTAKAEGNQERVITHARYLYLHSYNIEGDFYGILKTYVPHEQWNDFALQLAEDVLHTHWTERYADICAQENWHQRLMDYAAQATDIRILRRHESLLLKDHRQEVIDCYVRYIWHQMEGFRCRATYQDVCYYLSHIGRLGAEQQAASIASELRVKYRRCRALLEELDRLSI